MHQDVSESGDQPLFHFGVLLLHGRADTLSGLCQDLQLTDHSVLLHFIGEESLAACANVRSNATDGRKDTPHVE